MSIEAEKKIARKAAKALLDAGYQLGVHDGEEVTVSRTSSIQQIMDALATTDMDTLQVYTSEGTIRRLGGVLLIWGNGEDVISDVSGIDEATLEQIEAVIEKAFA